MVLSTFRRLRKDPVSAVANIAGLAVAVWILALSATYLRFETSYDHALPDADRIYRVSATVGLPSVVREETPLTSVAVAARLAADIPEVEAAVRTEQVRDTPIEVGDTAVLATALFADPGFFDVFRLPGLRGDLETALGQPNRAVLTESLARSLFGGEDAVGETLRIGGLTYEVGGVMRDLPPNSHFAFQAVLSKQGEPDAWDKQPVRRWDVLQVTTYVRLVSADARPQVERALPDLVARHGLIGTNPQDGGIPAPELRLQPLRDIHLHHHHVWNFKPGASRDSLTMIAAAAVAVLAIAVLNSANLMLTLSLTRTREIGMLKVMGASRPRVAGRFFVEFLGIAGAATLLGLGLAELSLPWFGDLLGRPLDWSDLPPLERVAFVVLLPVMLAVAAGAYPAYLLSGLRPSAAIGGATGGGGTGAGRTLASIVAFTCAIVLICLALGVARQLEFSRSQALGFQSDSLMVVEIPRVSRMAETSNGPQRFLAMPDQTRLATLKTELSVIPGIAGLTLSNDLPGQPRPSWFPILRPADGAQVRLFIITADEAFAGIYGLTILAGGPLPALPAPSDRLPGDRSTPRHVLTTANGATALGFAEPADAIGQLVRHGEADLWHVIVGVVSDIQMRSTRMPADPMLILGDIWYFNNITIRLGPGDPRPVIAAVEAAYRAAMDGAPPRWRFLDERIDDLYREELRQERLFRLFGFVAIGLAALGLFAAAALAVIRRAREIAMRRVVGATGWQIAILFGFRVAWPVLLANAIALPLAWFLLDRWLEGFAIRVDTGGWDFALAAAGSLLLAFLAVVLHVVRIARRSPLLALRAE